MQNPLAALLPIAPLSEAVSPAVSSTEVGDGSFGETFVDVVSSSEPVATSDDDAGIGVISPLAWGGLFLATPTASASENTSALDTDLLLSEGAVADFRGLAPSATVVDPASEPSVHQPPASEDFLPTSPQVGSTFPSLDTELNLTAGVPVADGPSAGMNQAPPEPSYTATSFEVPSAAMVPPSSDSTVGPLSVSSEVIQKVASVDSARPVVTVSVKNASDVALATVESADQSTGKGGPAAGADHSQGNSVWAMDRGMGVAKRAERANAAIAALPGKAVRVEPDVPEQIWRATVSSQHPVRQDLPGPVEPVLAGSDAVTAMDQSVRDPAAVAPSDTPPTDMEADPHPRVVSFWERFFAEESASAPTGSRSPSDTVSNGAVPPPAAALITLVARPLSEPEREHVIAQETSVVEPHAAVPTGPTLSKAATWSRQLLGDILSKAQPQLVFADWQGELSQPDQRPELSLSSVPLLSGGSSPGSPTATVVTPQFPVPYIASQIASVLVRNDMNMSELALAPEELGKVRLRMEPDSANPDRMVILISVERPETLDLFRRHAGDLAEAIRNAGYSGADISFGQNTQDNGSGHRRESTSAGPGSPFEEIGPVETARPHALGASLDLRL